MVTEAGTGTQCGRLRRWALLCTVPLLIAVLSGCSPEPLVRDEPRSLPYTLPDYRAAQSGWEVGEDGRIHAWVEHLFLDGIEPAQVAWFYRVLPVSTIDYQGKTYPLYHFFHPSEHGRLRVAQPATDGSVGMGLGAIIERDEWFGAYDSRGAARIAAYSDAGFLAHPEAFGLNVGQVHHQFNARDGGTAYRVDTVIGSEIPVLGAVLNAYLRTQMFHPAMLREWQRHQVQEVSTLRFLLPVIYPQRGDGNTAFVWPDAGQPISNNQKGDEIP